MQIITFVDVHKSFGQEIVFAGLSERLYAGQKVGMIGANGSGKTTFIKLILGEISPDVGEIVKRKGLRVGYLPQEPVFSGELTVMEEMHAGVEDLLRDRLEWHEDSFSTHGAASDNLRQCANGCRQNR